MITISFLSVKYTKKHIYTPLIKLKSIIEELSLGKVIDVPHSKSHDEVAEMKQSLQKHIEGIKEKINFTKNISKHNTRQNLVLTSSEDVLGNSLSKMAETINEKSNEITKLNLDDYEEINSKTCLPFFKENIKGIHHLDQKENLFVTDICFSRK